MHRICPKNHDQFFSETRQYTILKEYQLWYCTEYGIKLNITEY